jgi:hypothetical protein
MVFLASRYYATERLVPTGEFFLAHIYACGGNYRQWGLSRGRNLGRIRVVRVRKACM